MPTYESFVSQSVSPLVFSYRPDECPSDTRCILHCVMPSAISESGLPQLCLVQALILLMPMPLGVTLCLLWRLHCTLKKRLQYLNASVNGRGVFHEMTATLGNVKVVKLSFVSKPKKLSLISPQTSQSHAFSCSSKFHKENNNTSNNNNTQRKSCKADLLITQ